MCIRDRSSTDLEMGLLKFLIEAIEGMALKGLALHPVVIHIAADLEAETDAVVSAFPIHQQHFVGADHQHTQALEVNNTEASSQGAWAELHHLEGFAKPGETLLELAAA